MKYLPALLLCLLASASQAATTFVTNDSGNASALGGDGAGSSTALTLDAGDGGGILTVSTIAVYTDRLNKAGTATTLGTDANSMGVSNDKWGDPSQGWDFSVDQTIQFDALTFNESRNTIFYLESSAWSGDADASGTGWSFTSSGLGGSFGRFTIDRGGSNQTDFDLSSAGVSGVPAGTEIRLYKAGASSGTGLTSFTVTVVPEPSTLLLGVAGLGLLARRRRGAPALCR